MLSATHFIDCFSNVLHHMETVENYFGIRAVFPGTFLVGRTHVDAHLLDLFGLCHVLREFCGETVRRVAEDKNMGGTASVPSATAAKAGNHFGCVHAASESTADLNARKSKAQTYFANLLKATDLTTHALIWTAGDCPVCAPLNGTTYPTGWTTLPPLHHNCDCVIVTRAKS